MPKSAKQQGRKRGSRIYGNNSRSRMINLSRGPAPVAREAKSFFNCLKAWFQSPLAQR